MAFPVLVHGKYGDEKKAQSTVIGSLPLGSEMVLPDGRQFILGRASTAAALSAGFLAAGSVVVTAGTSFGIGVSLAQTAAVGDTTIAVTLGATAVTADQYKGGFLIIHPDNKLAFVQGF